jgi:hypothetical protein
MKVTFATLFAASFCSSLTSAIPLATDAETTVLTPRQNSSCENTATSRNCWGEYSIDTDWYTVTPDTGVTREVRSTGYDKIWLPLLTKK